MCAVGHFLEDEGLATVGITLVRPHVEAIEPPRALWVPFELGRPLGVPDDPAFQHRVLRAALDLLVCDDGPALLADYPEDAPAVEVDMEGWACPVALKPPPDESTGYEAAIAEEIASLRTWHDQAVKERGRSTVGVTDTDIVDVGRFLASQLGDAPQPSYREDLGLGDAVKLACDEIKAFYYEAAAAQPGPSTSAALDDWFWGETAAGKVFLALKAVCQESDDPAMKALGSFMLVPRAQLKRLPEG